MQDMVAAFGLDTIDFMNNTCDWGMFDTPAVNHSCSISYMPDVEANDETAIILDNFRLECKQSDGGLWDFTGWVIANALSSETLWPVYHPETDISSVEGFELTWYAPNLTTSWPVRVGPSNALQGLPRMRCDNRGEYDEEYGGLCLRPCAQRFYADTDLWDPIDPTKTAWGALVSSAGPTRSNPIPTYCACYHKPVTHNSVTSNSSFPWDLWRNFKGTEGNGTSLYYHHEFWKPAGGGDVTGRS
jgi:hypothetical protein